MGEKEIARRAYNHKSHTSAAYVMPLNSGWFGSFAYMFLPSASSSSASSAVYSMLAHILYRIPCKRHAQYTNHVHSYPSRCLAAAAAAAANVCLCSNSWVFSFTLAVATSGRAKSLLTLLSPSAQNLLRADLDG